MSATSMSAGEIRQRFLDYFQRQSHVIRPSSSLVPGDDPTLLFTNAGMVQFKKVFLGMEQPPEGKRRATTSQKCVRAGGKHNDLEQVGHTARHHTFFEMLGNFSFGDYFKRDAIRFAWEFVTEELKLPKEHLRVTVFHEDDEARALWREIAGIADSRIYGLGAKDNFWQMADTGPCGPCTEIYVDLAHLAKDWRFPAGASGEWTDTKRSEYSTEAFVEGAEAGRFLEIWNLVFMQFDRQPDGKLNPLPKPSVDTGAGLERIAAVMQGVTNNFHTDVFAPLIAKIEKSVGFEYRGRVSDDRYHAKVAVSMTSADDLSPQVKNGAVNVEPASFRVIADHARAVAFLLADGVFPSNDGRGYVLRRILRRGVRHAWLLGRRNPILNQIVETVIDTMGGVYPELVQRRQHIVETTRAEEERFLATIEGGMKRFDELAPAHTTQGSTELRGTISGDDAFRLYDTFGFPIDLTELMARERGYTVDITGFEAALEGQRTQSKEERKGRKLGVAADELQSGWDGKLGETRFVGYDVVEVDTTVTAIRRLDGNRIAVMLNETPFYAESGGQISDQGEIIGDGWRVDVDDVRKIDGRIAAVGIAKGSVQFGRALARVPSGRRKDTERNHTATHLLQAALRRTLGEQVHQAGSLVAPDRLRFDFTHHGPVKPEALAEIEEIVNREILRATPVTFREMAYREAVDAGAMALFGEKYGDRVRVVSVPEFSMELCGGTHVKNTSEIALFKIVSENGVAAGVRRIEAVTGPRAYEMMRDEERALRSVAERLKVTLTASAESGDRLRESLALLDKKLDAVLEERRALQKKLDDPTRAASGAGGDHIAALINGAANVQGAKVVAAQVAAADVKSLQAMGDALREKLGSGVGVLAASFEEGKHAILVLVTDDLRDRGIRADNLVKDIAAVAGGRGGGKPHMAQAGVPDASKIPAALDEVVNIVTRAFANPAPAEAGSPKKAQRA